MNLPPLKMDWLNLGLVGGPFEQMPILSWSAIAELVPPFLRPEILWFIPVGMVLTAVLWLVAFKLRVAAIGEYGQPELLSRVMTIPRLRSEWPVLAVLLLAVVAGFVAAAGPYQPLGPVSVPAKSIRLVAVVDGSPSMGAEDSRHSMPLFGGRDCSKTVDACGNRDEVAKQLLLQIMPAIQDNELGLVTFAGRATVLSYLNYDFSPIYTVVNDWDWLRVGHAAGLGSNLTAGLAAARKVFQVAGKRDGVRDVVVLFSDGGFDGITNDLYAQMSGLHEEGAELIVVGLGNIAASPIPTYTDGRPTGVWKLKNGEAALTARDDKFLDQLAHRAGGRYFPVEPGEKFELSWPSTLAGNRVELGRQDLFQWPLSLAMVLLAGLWMRHFAASILRLRLRFGKA